MVQSFNYSIVTGNKVVKVPNCNIVALCYRQVSHEAISTLKQVVSGIVEL